MNALLVLCLIGAASASYSGYAYHGKYAGKCSYDGLYYRDETSFVFCSNGYSSVQECSPGTKNSAYSKFSYGHSYSARDFCDVNLVDEGYGVSEVATYEAPAPAYHEPEPSYEPEPEPSYEAPSYGHVYQGKYPGKCGSDGLYYKDAESFVYCSNGLSYVQPCAPGTRNSGYGKYAYGDNYSERDFCDVNLVDGGYTGHYGYGYSYTAPSYAPEPAYHEPEPVYHPEPVYKPEPAPYKPGYSYHGRYPGKCEYDGLYYKNADSFVFCVNGNAYVQPCAPGTRNSGYGKFSYGNSYSERDFCDVNLVDGRHY